MKKHHTIISGTGRCGTTFLVQYFSALGLDTGFTLENSLSSVDSISNAGLEHTLGSASLPEIIKAPGFSDELYNNIDISIKDAIVPIRNLYDAAESRRRVFYESNNLYHPGSLWKTNDPEKQEMYLAMQFYKLIEQLVLRRVKIHFLNFPNFVSDHEELWNDLKVYLTQKNVTKERSKQAFDVVADPSKIHSFNKGKK